jgi:hypothetical protein
MVKKLNLLIKRSYVYITRAEGSIKKGTYTGGLMLNPTCPRCRHRRVVFYGWVKTPDANDPKKIHLDAKLFCLRCCEVTVKFHKVEYKE